VRSTKEFTRRVFAYIKQVNRDKELPSAAVRVGLVIADHWNENDGDAHPSLQTIALESGLGEGTVRRMLPHLIERGHLSIQTGSRGSGHPNHYRPLEKSANGGAIESANGGVIAKKPKAPFSKIKAPSETKKAPTGALNTVEHTEHSKSAPPARSTARVDRESIASNNLNTSDDASPNQRTADAALIEPVAAQELQPPERNETEMGRPAANRRVAPAASPFAQVLSVYPEDRVGDEAKAFFAFERALDARGTLSAVLEDIASLMLDYGDDVPFLADLMKTIERMP
jgi:hypothetical protein